MTPDEIHTLVDDGTIRYAAAGWLALIFFTAAWYLNRRLEGSRWSPWIVLPTGVTASLMLYASNWSVWLCEKVAGLLVGIGNMIDASMPVVMIMGVICILAMIGTVADLWLDSTYNIGAVWALIIAPVMAHGASGGVGASVNGAYSALTAAAIGAVTNLLGT